MEKRQFKDDRNYQWTLHSRYKMFQYNISPALVKRVTRFPDRVEEGIAPRTVAVMRRKDSPSTKKELWVMFQRVGGKKRIISTWIFPGTSRKGKPTFVPDDTLELLEKLGSAEQFSERDSI